MYSFLQTPIWSRQKIKLEIIEYLKKLILVFLILFNGCATTSPGERHNPIGISYLQVEEGNYDRPPEPIGGYAAIGNKLRYPAIAWEAGIEGTFIIKAFINEKGKVEQAMVLKGVPYTGLDETALGAIKQTKFNPATLNNEPVPVWISISIIFSRSGALFEPSTTKE